MITHPDDLIQQPVGDDIGVRYMVVCQDVVYENLIFFFMFIRYGTLYLCFHKDKDTEVTDDFVQVPWSSVTEITQTRGQRQDSSLI